MFLDGISFPKLIINFYYMAFVIKNLTGKRAIPFKSTDFSVILCNFAKQNNIGIK